MKLHLLTKTDLWSLNVFLFAPFCSCIILFAFTHYKKVDVAS